MFTVVSRVDWLGKLVSLAAVFSIITQCSSPQTTAHIQTTFLSSMWFTYFWKWARQRNLTNHVSMCNQMVTSEIREKFHARFVQILIISRAFIGEGNY